MSIAETNLRGFPRVGPTIIKARIISDGECLGDGYLINLSLGGGFIASEAPPRSGLPLTLAFDLPWALGEVSEDIRIVWSRERDRYDDAGAGFEFIDLGTDARARISRYLDRFERIAALIG